MESGSALRCYSVREGSGAVHVARVKGVDAVNMTQASMSTITCKVTNVATAAFTTPAVTIATSVFDTLQTDSRWTLATPGDTTGYNFRFELAPADIVEGGALYEVRFLGTPAVGNAFIVDAFRVFVIPLLGV